MSSSSTKASTRCTTYCAATWGPIWRKVDGIGYKKRDREGRPVLWLNKPQSVVPQERMDEDLPGYAWDLLPFRERPLDLYRAHFWHAGFDHAKRTPFAAIYTSLGCNFACDFCMINIVNRDDNGEDVHAGNSRGMRFWSPTLIAGELEKLARMGCETVRISDEMFFLNRRYYEPLLQQVVERDLNLRMWAYSRVDTVRPLGARAVPEGRHRLAGARHRGGQPDGPQGSVEGLVPGGQHPRRRAPRSAMPASTSSATTSSASPTTRSRRCSRRSPSRSS